MSRGSLLLGLPLFLTSTFLHTSYLRTRGAIAWGDSPDLSPLTSLALAFVPGFLLAAVALTRQQERKSTALLGLFFNGLGLAFPLVACFVVSNLFYGPVEILFNLSLGALLFFLAGLLNLTHESFN